MARRTAEDKTKLTARAWALKTLETQSARITEDPQTNSISALAHDMFSRLQTGDLSLSEIRGLATDLHTDTLAKRMEAFHEAHANLTEEAAWALTEKRLKRLSQEPFERYAQTVSHISGGIVFTAHPTFAMPDRLWEAAVTHARFASDTTRQNLHSAVEKLPDADRSPISLVQEHKATQAALRHARGAISEFQTLALKIAMQAYPDQWTELKPGFLTVASWVGYDLDGRTDIEWYQSFAFRLEEKAAALENWASQLAALANTSPNEKSADLVSLSVKLIASAEQAARQRTLFDADLSDPDNLVLAANTLTEAGATHQMDTSEVATKVRHLIEGKTPETALGLARLAAEIETTSLGTAHIHLRLNAAQIRTVIRRDLGLETEDRQLGRLALARLAEKVGQTKVRQTNFADLFLEQSTARRQFMMCAQILKHIDGQSPIRFLIAESENPATLMGALYLARQYGVDHALDLSPLFETPDALERGGRFIERLLEEPEFVAYVRKRGRLCIQLGFSDSGRFIGQVPAQMAIERIHSLIGRALADRQIGVDLLIFNTHGESIGRGAYPGTLKQRFDHLLTPWVRARFAKNNVPAVHEVSFQGSDGFLHFATPDLSRATVSALCEHLLAPVVEDNDDFYSRTDFTWDIYQSLRAWHERFFENRDYHRLLYAFAPQFLLKAGSRQQRRQGSTNTSLPSPRALRAIPQNAMLQQLAIPLNTVAAIGSSVNQEVERFIALANTSPRLEGLLLMAIRARTLTSLPALRAYARAFDPGYWTALSKYGEGDTARTGAHLRLGRYFSDYTTHTSIQRIANRLTVDLERFDRIIAHLDNAPSTEERHRERLSLHVLHATRIALMMHAFSLVAQVPVISARHDVSRTDLMQLISAWRVNDVIDRLCTVFPASPDANCLSDDLSEAGHTDCDDDLGYDVIHDNLINPLKAIARLNETLVLAISHAYGAYG